MIFPDDQQQNQKNNQKNGSQTSKIERSGQKSGQKSNQKSNTGQSRPNSQPTSGNRLIADPWDDLMDLWEDETPEETDAQEQFEPSSEELSSSNHPDSNGHTVPDTPSPAAHSSSEELNGVLEDLQQLITQDHANPTSLNLHTDSSAAMADDLPENFFDDSVDPTQELTRRIQPFQPSSPNQENLSLDEEDWLPSASSSTPEEKDENWFLQIPKSNVILPPNQSSETQSLNDKDSQDEIIEKQEVETPSPLEESSLFDSVSIENSSGQEKESSGEALAQDENLEKEPKTSETQPEKVVDEISLSEGLGEPQAERKSDHQPTVTGAKETLEPRKNQNKIKEQTQEKTQNDPLLPKQKSIAKKKTQKSSSSSPKKSPQKSKILDSALEDQSLLSANEEFSFSSDINFAIDSAFSDSTPSAAEKKQTPPSQTTSEKNTHTASSKPAKKSPTPKTKTPKTKANQSSQKLKGSELESSLGSLFRSPVESLDDPLKDIRNFLLSDAPPTKPKPKQSPKPKAVETLKDLENEDDFELSFEPLEESLKKLQETQEKATDKPARERKKTPETQKTSKTFSSKANQPSEANSAIAPPQESTAKSPLSEEQPSEVDPLNRISDEQFDIAKTQPTESQIESQADPNQTLSSQTDSGESSQTDPQTDSGETDKISFLHQKTTPSKAPVGKSPGTSKKLKKVPPPPPSKTSPSPVSKRDRKRNSPSLAVVDEVAESYALTDAETEKLQDVIITLEDKLETLEKQVYEPTEIINPLVPLMVQLLRMKVDLSQEVILETATPIIDEIIQKRSKQDRGAMSSVLAELIPDAIATEIKNSPEEIAKAIAPEIGAAIREQIRLERDSISKALGPEMGRAIKQQIEVERDAMVDALYPVIGSTMSKYMGEVVTSINEKVESTLSIEGISRKIRAKMQGVSEAELILRESMPITVQAIFLIHKASGLVISEIQGQENQRLESNMIAGMLTAIRSFVNDSIAESGTIAELNEIEYGDSRIILEVAGYCYLAVVVKGSPNRAYLTQIRNTLTGIIQKHDQMIESFEGDSDEVPEDIHQRLQPLCDPPKPTPQKKSPVALLTLIGIIFLVVFVPWVYFQIRGLLDYRQEKRIEEALTDLDAKTYTPIQPEVHRNTVTLTGRVPSMEVKNDAAQMIAGVNPSLDINNQITVVQVPPDAAFVATSIELVTALLNQNSEIDITAAYAPGNVIVRGTFSEPDDYDLIIDTYQRLPGVETVNSQQLLPSVLQERIYFDKNSSELSSEDISSKIDPIQAFLEDNPQVQLKIVGHTDTSGERNSNEALAAERAIAVQQALENQGIEPSRLEIEGAGGSPPDVSSENEALSRCVRFELLP